MRLLFTQDAHLQIGNAAGVVTHVYHQGESADVPDEVAALFVASGVALAAGHERAVKRRGERATK